MSTTKHPLNSAICLGTLTVGSKPIMVTDPCYEQGDMKLADMLPGNYSVWTEKTSDFGGVRNAGIFMVHDFIANASLISLANRKNEISEMLGFISVDAGIAGFYPGWTPNVSEKHYDQVCKSTHNDLGAGISSVGVTCSSGWGDGQYPVFCKRNAAGAIVALEIIFLNQKSDPRWADPQEEDEDYPEDDDEDAIT